MTTSPIPLAALEFHTGIVGKTGSGKSFAAQGEVERLIAKGERVCIIDPTDRYWGLRLSADGKRPSGHEVVIFGGAHADLPLAATHGAALAEIVGTTATPVIIATRLMTVGERTRWFTDFAETLLRKNEGPLHLVIDEAHLFAPQSKVASVESGKMLHAANNLVSLGRGIGLRIILISQRPAKLHKDCLTQVETLVALRLIAPQDRNAIREWVKEWADEATGAELMQSLPSLPTGTAWVWSPELGILHKGKFPAIATFDSGKPLASGKGPVLVPIDLAAVRGKLEVVAKEAIENDPARLRRKIADLEAQLARAPAADTGRADLLERQLQDAHERMAGMAEESQRVVAENAELRQALDKVEETLGEIECLARSGIVSGPLLGRPAPIAAYAPYLAPPAAASVTEPRRAPPPPKRAAGNGQAPLVRAGGAAIELPPARQRILDAVAWLNAAGIDTPARIQVALLADTTASSSYFERNVGALRTDGLLDYPAAGALALTDAGRKAAASPGRALTTADLHHRLQAAVEPARWAILDVLMKAYPDALDRETLAGQAGTSASSSYFERNVGALRTLGFLDYPSKGFVRAEPVLFIGGRR